MNWKNKAMLSLLIWAFVFPGVLVISLAFEWLALGLPLWLEVLISTALTVPLISLVAAPQVERVIAASRDQTVAELKFDEARKAPGPDPVEIASR